MESTCISILDLSIDARVLYVSNSITDILGYVPDEVVGKSCFEFFHPAEVPFARDVHGRGVNLDKAAVLAYCSLKNKDGQWVGCECVFTVVYDVLVASTSVYRRGLRSQKRAVDAPIVRRLFSSSPRDPRYHMLSLLSSKFSQVPVRNPHEPRAAMFLNRFTRTLTIMYATTALTNVLGLSPDDVKDKSFYECIQENCLADAIRCLESAKANDSIAYMRFWFRDPRPARRADDPMTDGEGSEEEDEDEDGGVYLGDHHDIHAAERTYMDHRYSATSSGNSTDIGADSAEAIFGHPVTAASSSSSIPTSRHAGRQSSRTQHPDQTQTEPESARIEVEAVVSCTSDGLVVVIRRAWPLETPPNYPMPLPAYTNGLFASPWASTPVMLPPPPPPPLNPEIQRPFCAAQLPNFGAAQPTQASAAAYGGGAFGHGGPPMEQFMNSIKDVAVFAWSLTGINGSLAQFGRGKPTGESQPPNGLPIWDSAHTHRQPDGIYNEQAYGTSYSHVRTNGYHSAEPEVYRDANGLGQHYNQTGYSDWHNGSNGMETNAAAATKPAVGFNHAYSESNGAHNLHHASFLHTPHAPPAHSSNVGYAEQLGVPVGPDHMASGNTNSHYSPWSQQDSGAGFDYASSAAFPNETPGSQSTDHSRWS